MTVGDGDKYDFGGICELWDEEVVPYKFKCGDEDDSEERRCHTSSLHRLTHECLEKGK